MIDCSKLFALADKTERYLGIDLAALKTLVQNGALRAYLRAFPKTAKSHLKSKFDGARLSLQLNEVEVSHEVRSAVEAGVALICEGLRSATANESRKLAEIAYSTIGESCIRAKIAQIENSGVRLMDGKMILVLPKNEQLKGDSYKVGAPLVVFVKSIGEEDGECHLVASRTAANVLEWFARKSFDTICGGLVTVNRAVRNLEQSTSILAISSDSIDAFAKGDDCVESLRKEFPLEKVILVPWNEKAEYFIAGALGVPIKSITINKKELSAVVEVFKLQHTDQAEFEVRQKLVPALTGWNILFKTSSEPASYAIGIY